ncbi:hypothetical protein ACLKA6_009796 [Drosophila palustris]
MRQQGKQKRVSVQCSFQESVRKNTFFEGTTLTIPKICSFVSWDCLRLKGETKCLMEEHGLSRQTFIDFKSFLREVYIDWSLNNSRQQIGGPGKIVEIDEAKVGKRKYNSGRVVKGQWVFGGIERESGDFFILPVEHRDTGTLLAIIQKRVADGSTIMSDCWKAYNCLAEEGFVHQMVLDLMHNLLLIDKWDINLRARAISRNITSKAGTTITDEDEVMLVYYLTKENLQDPDHIVGVTEKEAAQSVPHP